MSWGTADGYSRQIELHTESWDPTYGSGPPGIFTAHTCQTCGAVVDAAAIDRHTAWHSETE